MIKKDLASLILRVTFGTTMLIGHGWGKFLKLIDGGPIKWADPIGLGPELSLGLTTFAEVLCAALLVLGLFSRLAAIPLIITMLVAVFVVHINDPFGKLEMPILYLVGYTAILLLGSGKYSLDYLIRRKK
ncbi:DoxX family protein [Portibacter marinus]|uniref:DoxX family protein n=1 Tax=Portibacter marinus TaxID=2898660 RepID=UPI001F42172E|nr:DoxX family protein [Portibacter marinus]